MTYRRRYFAQPQLHAGARSAGRRFDQCAVAGVSGRPTGRSRRSVAARHAGAVADAGSSGSWRRCRRRLPAPISTRWDSPRMDGSFPQLDALLHGDRRRSPPALGPRHLLLLQPCGGPCQLTCDPVTYDVVHATRYAYTESVSVSHHLARLTPRTARSPGASAARDRRRTGRCRAVHAHRLLRQRRDLLCDAGGTPRSDGHGTQPGACHGANRHLRPSRHAAVGERRRSLGACRSRRSRRSSTPRRSRAAPEFARLRTAVVSRRAPAARGGDRSDRTHSRRLHVRSRRHDGHDVAGGSVPAPSWRVPGLHALRDCLPAVARHPRALRERLSRDDAASRNAAPRRRGCLACVADVSLPRRRLDRCRSHEQSAAVDGSCHARAGLDYGDVSPIRGVILGGGHHTLQVSVDVTRVSASESEH